MYLILQHAILLYPDVERGKDVIVKCNEPNCTLTAQCNDFNYKTNTLLADVYLKESDTGRWNRSIRLYNLH